jgi:hypothetical protein
MPEPDISVPFLSEIRKVYQGDYYRADKVLPLLKQWGVLYSVAKAGHEQAYKEAVKSAAENARLREALQFIASHDLDGADDRARAIICGLFIIKAKKALAARAIEAAHGIAASPEVP